MVKTTYIHVHRVNDLQGQRLRYGADVGFTKGPENLSLIACTLFCSMDPVTIFCKSLNRTRSSRDTDISGTHCKTCSPNTSTSSTNFRALCSRFCNLARAEIDVRQSVTLGVAQNFAKASFSEVLGCWLGHGATCEAFGKLCDYEDPGMR